MALVAGTIAVLRALVGARLLGRPGPHRAWQLLLDASPALIGFALFLLATARPLMAGLGVAALGLGLVVADRVKRAVLDEPVIFADRAELLDVVRHPRFYVSFVGWGPMVGGTIAIAAVIGGLLWAEPPLWRMPLGPALLVAGGAALLGRLAFVLPARPRPLARLARRYDQWKPVREPFEDARRFGMLGSCIMHATLARAERAARQGAAQARALPAWPADAGPVVLVQGESFTDVARLHPDLADALPQFARLRAEAALAGRLTVPCWGANTIRTELEVLAGLDTPALGLDRFNPYEAFARVPLPSLAHQARAAGYRTICVHPYARSFYGRDRIMPMLGFDRFIGIEAFADAPRAAGYVTDAALAAFVADLVRREGPRVFVFAVTIENHGPWTGKGDPLAPAAVPETWRALPDAPAIARWLAHAQATDAMIPPLRQALEEAGRGWLGFYGDHQPSLRGPFDTPAAPDRRTDYALWRVGGDAAGARRDLAAGEIAGEWLARMAG